MGRVSLSTSEFAVSFAWNRRQPTAASAPTAATAPVAIAEASRPFDITSADGTPGGWMSAGCPLDGGCGTRTRGEAETGAASARFGPCGRVVYYRSRYRVRAAEGATLEKLCGLTPTVGSNPTGTATKNPPTPAGFRGSRGVLSRSRPTVWQHCGKS